MEKPPTHPPLFLLFSLLGPACENTPPLLVIAPPPPQIQLPRQSQPGGLMQDFGLLQTGLLSGSDHSPFIPRVDVGSRERRRRMGKERAVAVTAASASVTVSGSRSECFSSFFLSTSLCSPHSLSPLPFLSHSLSTTAPAVWIHNPACCRANRGGTVSQRLGRNKSEDGRSRKQNKIQEEGVYEAMGMILKVFQLFNKK